MLSIGFLITGFLAIILIASMLSIRAKLPYTIVLVFVGIGLVVVSDEFALGTSFFGSTIAQIRTYLVNLASTGEGGALGGNLFVGLVVPPLIFEAMANISYNDFRAIFRPALTLATVGVVIATLAGGFLLWRFAGQPFYISFLFAAVISPTDTATVLELFRRIKVPSRLATLLDTEAAFNDATGIMIFTIILTSIASSHLSIFRLSLEFAIVFGGGVAVGLVIAFASEVLSSMVTDRMTEIILTISAVYGSYTLASALGFSGLIAVTIVGLYFGNLTSRSSVKPSNRESIKMFWEIAAFLGNSVAFLFIGLRTDIPQLYKSLELIIIAFLAVFAARAVTVYPILTFFDKITKKAERKIPFKWRNVAMLGGVRGALSIALAASIVTSNLVSSEDADTILNMVLGVAFVSIVLQSAFLARYIKRNFANEVASVKKEPTNIRIARALLSIDALRKRRDEGNISNEEFAKQLQIQKGEIEDLIDELESEHPTRQIVKKRTSELYSSIVRFPSPVKKSERKSDKKVNGDQEKEEQHENQK